MRFAYRSYEVTPSRHDPSHEVFRPALKVVAAGPRQGSPELPLWGLLDTGADVCVLPLEVADVVKPVWVSKLTLLEGFAGNRSIVRYGRVRFRLRIKNKPLSWSADVAFLADRESALWGHSDFLERFRVTFDGSGKHFTMRPLPTTIASANASHPAVGRKRPTGPSLPISPNDQDP